MKRIYLLLGACLLCLSFTKGVAQSAAYGHIVFFGPDSANTFVACPGGTVGVSTSTTTTGYIMNVDTANISVDWGDGNVQSSTSTFLQGSYFDPSYFTHVYPNVGVYNAIFTFADGYGNIGSDTVTFNVTNNCGSIWTNVSLDTDGNGVGDVLQPGALILLTGQNAVTQVVPIASYTQNGQVAVNISGVDVTQSPYTLQVAPSWLAANGFIASPLHPVTQMVTLSPSQPVDDTPQFIVECDGTNPVSQTDLSVNYTYGWGFRAGQQTGYLHFNVCNLSCSGAEAANLSVTFESLLSVYSSDIPGATVTGNTLNANLNVDGCTMYTIFFDVPGATPASTPLNFSVSVTPTANTDFDVSNNTRTCVSEVRNSWDPNDKNSDKPEMISPNVQDEMTYVIRFQNMGNDEAYNIVVKDTIDTDLDLSTLTLVEYSHNVQMNVNTATRVVTFNFPNINLAAASVDEPASHGTVVYKIKENPNLPIGTELTNTAYIYFDFNPPIVTNTAYNINQIASIEESVSDDIRTYPVPASDYIVVSSKQDQPIESIKLIDITGKTVMNLTTVGSTQTLDLQGVASGAYTLAIQSQGVVVNKKIMIDK